MNQTQPIASFYMVGEAVGARGASGGGPEARALWETGLGHASFLSLPSTYTRCRGAAPMAAEVAAAAPAEEPGWFGMVGRVSVIWFIMSQVMKGRTAQQQQPQVFDPDKGQVGGMQPVGGVQPGGGAMSAGGRLGGHPGPHGNAFRHEDLVDLAVYVSDAASFDAFDDASALVWSETGLLYSSGNPHLSRRALNVSVAPRYLPQLRANTTSLWAHVYIYRAATSPDPSSKRWRRLSTAEAHTPLVSYVPRVLVKATKNLLSGEFKDNVDAAAALELNANPAELTPHWKGSLSVQLVADFARTLPLPLSLTLALSLSLTLTLTRWRTSRSSRASRCRHSSSRCCS